jgi:arylsulfatase A-like enzyme
MPGYDKWFAQRHNALYYNYSVIQSDNGVTAFETKHGDSFYEDYFPDLVTNRTLAMIEEFTAKEGESRTPFLAVNSWPTPHGPFTPAPWAEDFHDGARAPHTPNYNASDESNQQKHWLVRQQSPLNKKTAKHMDKTMEKRLESLHSVDHHIGQIVDLLEKKGELENTYFIYTSDNGFQLGQHRLGADKRHLYENDIRVPFIIAGPGVPKNVTSYKPVLNVDIAPTIYEMVTGESEAPSSMDGASIMPYLQSLQEAIEAGDDTKINDPNHREDFLVSYYGEGETSCGLKMKEKQCPGDPSNFRAVDSRNNTYHCVRSLTVSKDYELGTKKWCNDGVCGGATPGMTDSIYCRFEDNENFVEYYDHLKDKWQLTNRADELSGEERNWFEARLAQLRSCQGASCRSLPSVAI